jgi:hypothetical protein
MRISRFENRCYQDVSDPAASSASLLTLGRFQPKWETHLLLIVVRDVLVAADPTHPDRVTQRAYNDARAIAGYADSPRADRLAKRFKVPWSALIARVMNDQNPAWTLSSASKERQRQVLTSAEVCSAITTVAARLGTSEISVADYEPTRQIINRELARRHLHGAHLTPLPSMGTIQKKMSFADAVQMAGLTMTPIHKRGLMPRAEAVRLFIEHYGFAPRVRDLRWFRARHGIQLVGQGSQSHLEILSEVRAQFVAEGRWWPERVPKAALPEGWQAAIPDSPDLQAARAAYPANKANAYTLSDVVAGLHRAFELLPPGEKLVRDRYAAISKAHRLPQYASVLRVAAAHGTSYGQLVRQVSEERAAAIKDD